jgi:dihydrodipicolinate synthase/N-acetylneuraminate lyase
MPETIGGTWGTVLVPWTAGDRVDVARLTTQIDALCRAGLAGVYAHGTAGEFHELDEDEWDLISATLAERCRAAGVPFQLGAGHMSGRLTGRRIDRAVALHPDAIQVILPDWVPSTVEDAIAAVTAMAERAGGVPLVLYNPPHAKTVLAPDALGRLAAAVPSLIGVKTGAGGADWYAAIRPYTGRLAIFVPGHTLATGVPLGAAGSFSNVACLSPAGAVAWERQIRSDHEAALDVQRRLVAFLEQYVLPWGRAGHPNPALDKALAHIGGWADAGTRIRGPWRSVPADEAERLRPVIRASVPELFIEQP